MTPRCMHGYDRQYFGGTNFARTSGGPFITTSYDYDAPIDEYGVYLSIVSCKLWSSFLQWVIA
jgi:hypothetical protein